MRLLAGEGICTLLEIRNPAMVAGWRQKKSCCVAANLLPKTLSILAPLLAAHATPAGIVTTDGCHSGLRDDDSAALAKGLFDAVDLFCESVGFNVWHQSERVLQTAKALGIPVKGHVEQLSLLGGAQLVSRYQEETSADHIEYLDEAGVAAMRDGGTVGILCPARFIFCARRGARRWNCCAAIRCLSPSPAISIRHQPVLQFASGDEYGLRTVWSDAGRRGMGGRYAPCRSRAGRRRRMGSSGPALPGGFCGVGMLWEQPVEIV